LYSVLYKLKGDTDKAVFYLIEAMELAADEDLLLFFVFDTEHIKDLLPEVYKIQATKKTKIPDKFINKFKLAVTNRKKHKKIYDETDLSIRELDTLKLIAEECTNQEIANKLFISLNTVKSHVKNIHLKLDVASRTKAVIKAKELGLL